jgi:hypothetical protein
VYLLGDILPPKGGEKDINQCYLGGNNEKGKEKTVEMRKKNFD